MTDTQTNTTPASWGRRPPAASRSGGPAWAPLLRLARRVNLLRTPRRGDVRLGERLITPSQLEKMLEHQKRSDQPLGKLIVEAGYASEPEVLSAIAKHYRVSADSLSENIAELIESRSTLRKKLVRLQTRLRLKLALAAIFIVWVTALLLSLVVLTRHKEQLLGQTVRVGASGVRMAADLAAAPLLAGDVPALNRLLRETVSAGGLRDGYLVDNQGVVRAASERRRIGQRPGPATPLHGVHHDGAVRYYVYRSEHGGEALHLSAPVTAQNRERGRVHANMSLAFIRHQVRQDLLYVVLVGLLVALLGIGLALYLSSSLLRPVAELIVGGHVAAGGDDQYAVNIRRHHEFEDLTSSFNFIARELRNKLLMEKSLGRYVSPALLQTIRTNPEEPWLKGTRNEATILFTDVRGFTALSETKEPEELVTALNEYFAVASRAVLENGGYVDKLVGDAVLGVFGVPETQPDHAIRAVRAAVAMQKALRRKARMNVNPLLHKVGIGINTGIVVAGNIGSEEKVEYTVIGDAVNVASRLNGLAASGEIIISRSVYDQVEKHLITVSELGPQQVKGKSEPVEALKVLKTDF